MTQTTGGLRGRVWVLIRTKPASLSRSSISRAAPRDVSAVAPGQLEQAATDAKKALELSPDVWPGRMLLSKIYLIQGRPEDALPEITRVRYEAQRAFLHDLCVNIEAVSELWLSRLPAMH